MLETALIACFFVAAVSITAIFVAIAVSVVRDVFGKGY